jgi:hypothetical protein
MQTKNRKKKEDEGEDSNPESEQDFVKKIKTIRKLIAEKIQKLSRKMLSAETEWKNMNIGKKVK